MVSFCQWRSDGDGVSGFDAVPRFVLFGATAVGATLTGGDVIGLRAARLGDGTSVAPLGPGTAGFVASGTEWSAAESRTGCPRKVAMAKGTATSTAPPAAPRNTSLARRRRWTGTSDVEGSLDRLFRRE
jgi:hypothetical protein